MVFLKVQRESAYISIMKTRFGRPGLRNSQWTKYENECAPSNGRRPERRTQPWSPRLGCSSPAAREKFLSHGFRDFDYNLRHGCAHLSTSHNVLVRDT